LFLKMCVHILEMYFDLYPVVKTGFILPHCLKLAKFMRKINLRTLKAVAVQILLIHI
jgi:hypothetical protein